MKVKMNIYYFIFLILALKMTIFCSAKNVLLLSNMSTSKGKNCFFIKLIRSFRLKKFEKKIPPVENIYIGKIGEHPITFFDVKKFTEDQQENSKIIKETFQIMNTYNITTIDSILLFYALNHQNPNKIENDIETLKSIIGEKITKTIVIAAINQRRILNVKRTYLDSLTHKYNISYIHIHTICEDELDRELVIYDFNFLFKQTAKFDLWEYVNSFNVHNVPEKKTSYNLIFLIFVVSVPILVLCFIKLCKLLKVKDFKVRLSRKVKGKEKERETPLSCHELRKQMSMVSDDLQVDEANHMNPVETANVDYPNLIHEHANQINKEEIQKEIEGILNHLEVELLEDEEEQQKANNSNLIEPAEAIEAVDEVQEISEEVESIQPSDSEDIIRVDENEINTKPISTNTQNEKIGTKNDWEILN
jgi:hypothetical protein